MKMFSNNRLRYDDPSRQRVFDHLQSNLDDILRCGRESGTPIILSTMAVNLKDCGPFGSLHRVGLDANQQSAWEKAYQEGVSLESTGLYQQAVVPYGKAAEIDAQFADLQFRIGRCHLALTNFSQARQDFELACDYDALAFRADTRINQAIKGAAARYDGKGVYFVDAAETLAGIFPHHAHAVFLLHPGGIPRLAAAGGVPRPTSGVGPQGRALCRSGRAGGLAAHRLAALHPAGAGTAAGRIHPGGGRAVCGRSSAGCRGPDPGADGAAGN